MKEQTSKIDISDEEKTKLCLQCKLCCKLLHFAIPYDFNSSQFYLARGLRFSYEPKLDSVMVEIPHVCPHLDEVTGCKIYEDRPDACKSFDCRDIEALKGRRLWPEKK